MKVRPRMLAIYWEAKWHLLWLTSQGDVSRDGQTYLQELSADRRPNIHGLLSAG
jgi:hypothetical protein